jgi:diadenosine tetraphosphate (Ap4A) HIT family hydrolase
MKCLPLPQPDSCYLCDLINGHEGAWSIIARSELTVTALNGRQFEVGQCMVFPVRHAPTLLDLTTAEDAAIMASAKQLAQVMVDTYAPDGVLLYQNNGTGSGQEVPHFHLHVVPRRKGSDWGFGPPHIARLEKEGRPDHLDYSVVTEAKGDEVANLRKHFAQEPKDSFSCHSRMVNEPDE